MGFQQVSYSVLDSNVPAKTRYIYFFKDAKDLHDCRTHMPLQGKHGGLVPETFRKVPATEYLNKI